MNYLLLYIREKVGVDKNIGDRGSANGGGGGRRGSVSVRPMHCVTVTPVHGLHRFSHPVSIHKDNMDIADKMKN